MKIGRSTYLYFLQKGETMFRVRGGRVRVMLALATTGVVAAIGISVGSGSGAANQQRALGSAPLAPSGNTVARTSSRPNPRRWALSST